MISLTCVKYEKGNIDSKRNGIAELLVQKSQNIRSRAFTAISAEDLGILFELYDGAFFNNRFMDGFKGRLKFSLSTRMTKSAGLTLCPKNVGRIRPEDLVLEIRIGVDFFFQYYSVGGSKNVCGTATKDSLEALLLVFEHELCHVIEFINFGRSNCKGKRFKTLAFNIFGHTESCHRLPTNRQIARQRLGLKIGDAVRFTAEGRKLQGIIYNINKNATVMVKDSRGPLRDRKGTRYSKYYVPLQLLELLERDLG